MARDRAFLDALREKRGPNTKRDADATRTVYADWLEQQGDLPRAELLRLARTTTKKARARRAELAAITSNTWRRTALPPLGRADAERLPLAAAVARIERADHPRAEAIAKRVTDWVESFGEDEDDPSGQVLLYDGDLVIAKGSLETGASAVCVLGDATIADQFTDLVEADQSLFAVAGNLTCRAIWQLGDSYLAGDVTCDVLYGSSYSSNRTEIGGNATVKEAIIENGHHIVIHGSLSAPVRIGNRISAEGRYLVGSSEGLDPALLEDESLDEARLYKRICDGKSVLPKPGRRRA